MAFQYIMPMIYHFSQVIEPFSMSIMYINIIHIYYNSIGMCVMKNMNTCYYMLSVMIKKK